MITRAKSGIFKPKVYSTQLGKTEPGSYEEAIKDDNRKQAMNEEYNALIRNKIWSLVSIPDKNVIGCNWTY